MAAAASRTTMDENLSREEILKRAEQGDQTMLPMVREMLDQVPQTALEIGNLATMAQEAFLRIGASDNLLARECQERALRAMRHELAEETPSPLETLLVDRIVLCWQHVHVLETCFAQGRDVALAVGDYRQRCIDRAHRRLLSAVKALAQVRKLGITLQVNVATSGGKQVNVAGGDSTPRA